MEQFTSKLLAQMNSELQQIAVTSENRLQQSERSFHAVQQVIAEVNSFITGYTFKSTGEEIQFFKEIKPEFQKELIYNDEVFFIESNIPVGPQKARKLFLERTLAGVQAYFEKNSLIYNYWRSGATTYDELYFVRNARPFPLVPVSYTEIDPSFSNPYSNIVARLKALAEIRDYVKIHAEGNNIPAGEAEPQPEQHTRKMTFTGPKAALEEILQAISAKGWINYGDLPVSQLFRDIGGMLNVKLGDPSRGLIGMAIRKKGYTPHIDGMKDALVHKIEEKHQ